MNRDSLLQEIAEDVAYVTQGFARGVSSPGFIAELAPARLSLWREAADAEIDDAQWLLGQCYMNGIEVAADPEEAVRWYRRASENGNAKAQTNLGRCYTDGAGVPEDQTEGMRWMRRAAEAGFTWAQVGLGLACIEFEDFQNLEEARRWLQAAADQHDGGALYYLGYLVLTGGLGEPPDPERGAALMRASAEIGHVDGMRAFGTVLLRGRGVASNRQEGFAWLARAAAAGDERAAERLQMYQDALELTHEENTLQKDADPEFGAKYGATDRDADDHCARDERSEAASHSAHGESESLAAFDSETFRSEMPRRDLDRFGARSMDDDDDDRYVDDDDDHDDDDGDDDDDDDAADYEGLDDDDLDEDDDWEPEAGANGFSSSELFSSSFASQDDGAWSGGAAGAELHIRIKLSGDSFASAEELALRHKLEDLLLEADVGEFLDAGSGLGYMDVTFRVADFDAAAERIRPHLAQLGIADRTEILRA